MRPMMSRRVQDGVEEAALEIDVRVVEQSRDAGPDVVENDHLVGDAERQQCGGADPDGQEDVEGKEVRRPQHLEPIQTVVNRVHPPEQGHFVRPPVIPVLEEVDDQRDEQQLKQDVGAARPEIEDSNVLVILRGCREQPDQQKGLKPVERRREQEVDGVRSRQVAQISPTVDEGNRELQAQDQEDRRQLDPDGDGLEGIGTNRAPPEHQQRADQDRAVGVVSQEGPQTLAFRRAHELSCHREPSEGQIVTEADRYRGRSLPRQIVTEADRLA